MKRIYCDNAAQRPLLPEVRDYIKEWLDKGFCNPSAIYSEARACKKAIEEARATVAQCIGADPDEIFFTSGATEGINMICKDDPSYILTTGIEHKAIIRHIGRRNLIATNENGRVNIEKFYKYLTSTPDRFTVIIGWVNNEIGTIQPIDKISGICQETKACLCIDATQALGHIPINVHEIGCSALVGSFHKVGGLAGSGFMYIKRGSYFQPLILGGGQEKGMRAGTENFLGIVAGARALQIATTDLDMKVSNMTMIRDNIITQLLEIPKSYLNGSLDNRVCNNINISFAGIEGESLVLNLDLHGIEASSGSACNSVNIEPSHVLKAIGYGDHLAKASLRLTISEGMTLDEADYVVKTVKKCVGRLRVDSPKWKEICNESNRE